MLAFAAPIVKVVLDPEVEPVDEVSPKELAAYVVFTYSVPLPPVLAFSGTRPSLPFTKVTPSTPLEPLPLVKPVIATITKPAGAKNCVFVLLFVK
tara:strand:- start:77 stop:361 length:285 start_codon:yes stop_codon:yes gene_type:complete